LTDNIILLKLNKIFEMTDFVCACCQTVLLWMLLLNGSLSILIPVAASIIHSTICCFVCGLPLW